MSNSVSVEIECCKFVFQWVVGRKLYGSISMCRFPIDSYVFAVGVSVNGKIQVVHGIVFFFRQFEFQMLVYVLNVAHYCLSIGFVLVKYDQNVMYIFFVVYYLCFQSIVLCMFLQKTEGKSLL